MTARLFPAIRLLSALLSISAIGAPPPGYTLVFADEFNGESLDTNLWQYRVDGKAFSQQTESNVTVAGGLLHIVVKKQAINGYDYSGGGVISKMRFRYGYYEARIRSPSAAGWHSSFWSQAYNGQDTGTQLANQEIDFSEHDSSSPNRFTANYHVWNQGDTTILGPYSYTGIIPGMNEFHVISALFTPTRVFYYIDGIQYSPPIDITNYPIHNDANIWLSSIATIQPADNGLPDEFQVDWVRYYAPPTQIFFSEFNPVGSTARDLIAGTGSTITLSGDTVLMAGGSVTAASGSVMDLFNATVALPTNLTLTDVKFGGAGVQLLNNATLTLQNGSALTAAAGSSVNLSAASIQFPTTVVLTAGTQTLSGKTFVTPIMSSVRSPAATNLSLSAGSGGANLTLGQGSNGNVTLGAAGTGNINLVPGTTNGVVQVGPSANANSFFLTSRTQVSAFPAVMVQASTPNTVTAFDVMPNGAPAEILGGNGWSWIDVCDTDQRTINTAVRTARVGYTSSGAVFGSRAFNGAAVPPVLFNVDTANIITLGAISGPSWTTTGQAISVAGNTYNNSSTPASGTAPSAVFTSFSKPFLSATNANVTTTRAATVYIANEPGAGANQTITNANALWIAHGSIYSADTTGATSTSTGALQIAGGAGIGGALYVGGAFNGVQQVGSSYIGDIRFTSSARRIDTTSGNKLDLFGVTVGNGTINLPSLTGTTSTSTGALVVAGGFGLGGSQTMGGQLVFTNSATISSGGAVSITAGGANKDISLTPRGTGAVTTGASIRTTSVTSSTSTTTGALVVSGGAAVQKDMFFGGNLVVVPVGSTTSTIRVSGTAIANTPGIWFRDGGAPTAANVALSGSSASTTVNGPANGALNLRIGGTTYAQLNPTALLVQSVPLTVSTNTASTSTTTGSATFAGGIGVAGRTSTGSINVGTGTTLNGILSAIASLSFSSIAARGGTQDLSVTVTGAAAGNDVIVVEADGAFATPGIILHAIVSAANTVVVRATNVTNAPISISPRSYRVTVRKL